jgi:hypothetical protein
VVIKSPAFLLEPLRKSSFKETMTNLEPSGPTDRILFRQEAELSRFFHKCRLSINLVVPVRIEGWMRHRACRDHGTGVTFRLWVRLWT